MIYKYLFSLLILTVTTITNVMSSDDENNAAWDLVHTPQRQPGSATKRERSSSALRKLDNLDQNLQSCSKSRNEKHGHEESDEQDTSNSSNFDTWDDVTNIKNNTIMILLLLTLHAVTCKQN